MFISIGARMSFELDNNVIKFRTCGAINTKFNEEIDILNETGVFDGYISSNELNILLLLAKKSYSKNSEFTEISFQGIKLKLNIHQQKITNALKRLMKKNLINKTINGYSLSKKGFRLINKLLNINSCLNEECGEYIGIEISFSLKKLKNQENILRSIYLLKKRWFSHWRYVGIFTSFNSIKMEWQSLSRDLEACLCVTNEKLRIAIFDKTNNPNKVNLKYLEIEIDDFLSKIQKIIGINLLDEHQISKYMIITSSCCDKLKMKNWLSTYT